MWAKAGPSSTYERDLLGRAGQWPAPARWQGLTAAALEQIAAGEGVDFATVLLYDRLRRSEEHGPFIAQLESGPAATPEELHDLDATVAIVPGAFYVESPHTGADGHFLLDLIGRLGCRAVRIPVASFGRLVDNARLICQWLLQHDENNVILVSLSKGGAELKVALTLPEAALAFRRVVAWVNICGMLQGTPLVAWLRRHPLRLGLIRLLFWLRRHPFQALGDLGHGPGGLLDGPLRLPHPLQVIHLIGFPLAYHMSTPLSRRGYRRLAPLGPNDGAVLLGDAASLPGLIYPVWGADHYMRPAWDIRHLVLRLLSYLCREMHAERASPGVGNVCHAG